MAQDRLYTSEAIQECIKSSKTLSSLKVLAKDMSGSKNTNNWSVVLPQGRGPIQKVIQF